MTWTWNGSEAVARIRMHVKAGTPVNDVLAQLQLPQAAKNVVLAEDAEWLGVAVRTYLCGYVVWYRLYDRNGNVVDMVSTNKYDDHTYWAAIAHPGDVAWIKDVRIRRMVEAKMVEERI